MAVLHRGDAIADPDLHDCQPIGHLIFRLPIADADGKLSTASASAAPTLAGKLAIASHYNAAFLAIDAASVLPVQVCDGTMQGYPGFLPRVSIRRLPSTPCNPYTHLGEQYVSGGPAHSVSFNPGGLTLPRASFEGEVIGPGPDGEWRIVEVRMHDNDADNVLVLDGADLVASGPCDASGVPQDVPATITVTALTVYSFPPFEGDYSTAAVLLFYQGRCPDEAWPRVVDEDYGIDIEV